MKAQSYSLMCVNQTSEQKSQSLKVVPEPETFVGSHGMRIVLGTKKCHAILLLCQHILHGKMQWMYPRYKLL